MKKLHFRKPVAGITILATMASTMLFSLGAAGSVKTAGKAAVGDKYDSPVTVTVIRSQASSLKFVNGEDWDNNIYTRAWLKELGIIVKNQWVVPDTQYEQKLNVAIASGDLADIIWAPPKEFSDILDNDQAYDLTSVYAKYASPLTKEILEQDMTSFNTAKRNGKLYGLPVCSSTIDQGHMIWYRSDWAKKLGIKEPKSMKDLLAMAKLFTTKDPDGNGKNDTIGIALSKNFIVDGAYGAQGFFAGYHAYPRTWVKDASGKLVYGSIQPQVKTALKQLQELYKAGELDKEFGVKDGSKVGETIASGKVGIEFGAMWNPLGEMQQNINNDKKADWKAIPLVSIDKNVAKPKTAISVEKYFVVNKNCKHPEAAIKLMNYFSEKSYGKTADNAYGIDKAGTQTYQYSPVADAPVRKNLVAHNNIIKAMAMKDPSKLNAEEKGYYDKIVAFSKGDRAGWGMYRIFYTPSSYDVISNYVKTNAYQFDGFYGAPTETMTEKEATLEKMEEEVFTKIIMGDPISTFDSFVSNWKKLGGDQITKEVNNWASKNK